MKPRIYTYKITFPHQGWWYWGVHKEQTFGESYNGSPVTHSEKWENFEFEKQILEFFDNYDEAREVEGRLIGPDLHNPMCLNENASGGFSLEANSRGGKIVGKRNVESGLWASLHSVGGKVGGKIVGKRNVESGHLSSIQSKGGKNGQKVTNSQQWKCLVTGHVSSPGPLSRYQKSRGIDTNQRIRVK
jgi:hypothetical protein